MNGSPRAAGAVERAASTVVACIASIVVAGAAPGAARAADTDAVRTQPLPVVGSGAVRADASKLAQRLGSEASVDGLRKLVALRDGSLLQSYASGLDQAKLAMLPPSIQDVVVAHFRNPQLTALLEIPALGRYGSRALLDLIVADLAAGRFRPDSQEHGYLVRGLANADAPGAGSDILALVRADCDPAVAPSPERRLRGDDCRRLYATLADRRDAAFRAWVGAQIRNAPPMAPLGLVATEVLAGRLPDESTRVLADRLAALGQRAPHDDGAMRESALILARLAAFPAAVAIDYPALRAGLAQAQIDANREHLVAIVAKRRDDRGLPDLYGFMAPRAANDRVPLDVIGALSTWGNVEVWREGFAVARRLHDEGRLDDARWQSARQALGVRVADPDRYLAQAREQARFERYRAEVAKLGTLETEASALRQSNPDEYVAAMLRNCEALRQLNAAYADLGPSRVSSAALVAQYLALGSYVRFERRDARRALDFYRAAEGAAPPASSRDLGLGPLLTTVLIADTLQFDLRDVEGALAQYRSAAQSIRSAQAASPVEAQSMLDWWAGWFDAEIRFLAEGRRYSGRLGGEAAIAFAMLPLLASQAPPASELARTLAETPIDAERVAKAFRALPASRTTLAATVHRLACLPDADAILAFLDRNDPSGYWTATLFAVRAGAGDKLGLPGVAPGSVDAMFGARDGTSQAMRIAAERYAAGGSRP